jgi:hypothetical protein
VYYRKTGTVSNFTISARAASIRFCGRSVAEKVKLLTVPVS